MIDLTGRVALVTGASRGIGKAIALRLAEAGADIVLNYVSSQGAAEQTAESIAALGRNVAVVRADVTEEEDIAEMLRYVGETFGRLDILVSNAASGGFRPLMSARARHFDATMTTNVKALLHLVQQAAPLLQRSPGRGKVVALSSHGSHLALPAYGLIGASKAALESLIRHFALELGNQGVNFNVVQAGLVETDSTRLLPMAAEMIAGSRQQSMVGERALEPTDVANAVLFLASPLSDLIQGQTLIIDGGAAIHV